MMEQKKINRLSREDLQYIAGFIDGDGSIIAQIVKSAEYKYGHTIRVSVVLYQKTRRYWFLKQMQKAIGGHLRKKKDGMSDLTITGFQPVKILLSLLKPFLRIKKPQAREVLEIIDEYENRESKASFLKVCQKVDKTADLNDSKKRKHTYSSVIQHLNCPVETEK